MFIKRKFQKCINHSSSWKRKTPNEWDTQCWQFSFYVTKMWEDKNLDSKDVIFLIPLIVIELYIWNFMIKNCIRLEGWVSFLIEIPLALHFHMLQTLLSHGFFIGWSLWVVWTLSRRYSGGQSVWSWTSFRSIYLIINSFRSIKKTWLINVYLLGLTWTREWAKKSMVLGTWFQWSMVLIPIVIHVKESYL